MQPKSVSLRCDRCNRLVDPASKPESEIVGTRLQYRHSGICPAEQAAEWNRQARLRVIESGKYDAC